MLVHLTLPENGACDVYLHQWGDEQSTRIMFCVHGLTRNGMDFEKLSKVAADKGFRVIAPDMPGRGKSPALANPVLYNNMVNASLCLQILAQLGITQVDWVGTSMGGMIALLIANQAPHYIRKLVLNDIGCMVPATALKRITEYATAAVYGQFTEAETALKIRTQPFAIPDTEWKHFAENSIEHTAQGYRIAYDPAIIQIIAASDIQDVNLWPLWEKVKPIPTLLIRGENSDLLSEETATAMQQTHPQLTRYNVAGAGHAPALMREAEINAVLGFLA